MPSAWQKRRFVEHLHHGGMVAYPTEAVFGLGCNPLNQQAVFNLLALKRRSWRKGLILIAADFSQLEPYLEKLPASIIAKINAPSQQATTWLLPAKKDVPKWLTGANETIAVRLVQHPLARELCSLAKMAIVSTSANFSAREPLKTAYKTRLDFKVKGVFTIGSKAGGAENPSRIIDPFSNRQLR
ncbi:MAG: L-threonylcarbamoyladenylate synthase [Cycloclasticus sp.]